MVLFITVFLYFRSAHTAPPQLTPPPEITDTFNFVPTAIQISGMLYGGLLGSWITFFAAYVAVPLADLLVGEFGHSESRSHIREEYD